MILLKQPIKLLVMLLSIIAINFKKYVEIKFLNDESLYNTSIDGTRCEYQK
jgi:hypothetical protein